jgi:hypothetical protein
MLITRRGKPVKTGKSIRLAWLLSGLCTLLPALAANPPVQERADPNLPDIAAVQYEPGKGAVIRYNPFLCKQAGRDLCEFYRYHEYGHIALRHYERTDISVQEKEEEADRWAAKHAPRKVVLAAWRFFSAGGGSTPMHGDGPTRAARLVDARNLVALGPRLPPEQAYDSRPLFFEALAL